MNRGMIVLLFVLRYTNKDKYCACAMAMPKVKSLKTSIIILSAIVNAKTVLYLFISIAVSIRVCTFLI